MIDAELESFLALDAERRFMRLLELLRNDAVAATRAYRMREVHRGRTACPPGALCDECSEDILLCVMQVFTTYEGAVERGRCSPLRDVVDAVITGSDAVAPGLLRTLLANAGKDARRRMATATGRAAKPADALLKRRSFARLRDDPLVLDAALILVQFAHSNTALPPALIPFDRIAAGIGERCADRGEDVPEVRAVDAAELVRQAMAIMESADADWVQLNIIGPISERMSEFIAPPDSALECPDGPWGEVTGRWGAA